MARVVQVDDEPISYFRTFFSSIMGLLFYLSGIVLVLRGFVVISGPDFDHLVTVKIPVTDLTPPREYTRVSVRSSSGQIEFCVLCLK